MRYLLLVIILFTTSCDTKVMVLDNEWKKNDLRKNEDIEYLINSGYYNVSRKYVKRCIYIKGFSDIFIFTNEPFILLWHSNKIKYTIDLNKYIQGYMRFYDQDDELLQEEKIETHIGTNRGKFNMSLNIFNQVKYITFY